MLTLYHVHASWIDNYSWRWELKFVGGIFGLQLQVLVQTLFREPIPIHKDQSKALLSSISLISGKVPKRLHGDTVTESFSWRVLDTSVQKVLLLTAEASRSQFLFIGNSQKPYWAALAWYLGKFPRDSMMSLELHCFLKERLRKDWRNTGAVSELLEHTFLCKKTFMILIK